MVKKIVYNVFDTVSERFLGDFIANNEKVAKLNIKKFCVESKANLSDLKLMKVCEYESPIVPEDFMNKKLSLVDCSDITFDEK